MLFFRFFFAFFFIARFASFYFVRADLKATNNDVDISIVLGQMSLDNTWSMIKRSDSRDNSEMLSFNVAFRKLNPRSTKA